MDAVQWAKDQTVDLLIPAPFWMASDFDIPVEKWLELLENVGMREKIAFAPGFEHNIHARPGGKSVPNDLASLYGFVASACYRGARNILQVADLPRMSFMPSGSSAASRRQKTVKTR